MITVNDVSYGESQDRMINADDLNRMAALLKSIGHPVRLNILQLLDAEPGLCVSEIQNKLPQTVEQSLLSHHLIKLKENGVLNCEREGIHIRYSLANPAVMNIFDCIEKCNIL